MQSFKKYVQNILFIESIQKELTLTFEESLKVAKEIESVIQKSGLKVPDELENIESIDPSDKKELGTLTIQSKDQDNNVRLKKQDAKMGKIFKRMFPNLPDNKIAQMVTSYYSSFERGEVEFLIEEDVYKWYQNRKVISCVNQDDDGFLEGIKLFNKLPDVKILIRLSKGQFVGRALFWEKLEGINAPYVDRIYPNHPENIQFFIDYAKENDWFYRKKQADEAFHTVTQNGVSFHKVSYIIRNAKNLAPEGKMPYLDTLRYGEWLNDNDLLITNDISKIKNKKNFFVFDYSEGYSIETPEEMTKEQLTMLLLNHISVGDIDSTETLLALGVPLSLKALSVAIHSKDLNMVKYIINKGAKLNNNAKEALKKSKSEEIRKFVKEYFGVK